MVFKGIHSTHLNEALKNIYFTKGENESIIEKIREEFKQIAKAILRKTKKEPYASHTISLKLAHKYERDYFINGEKKEDAIKCCLFALNAEQWGSEASFLKKIDQIYTIPIIYKK